MTTDLQVRESALVLRARELMQEQLTSLGVHAEREMAKAARGIVYQSDAQAAEGADLDLKLAEALKRLEAAKRRVLEVPRAMTQAVEVVVAEIVADLKLGRSSLTAAKLTWDRELQRQQEEARRALEAEAKRLAAEQANQPGARPTAALVPEAAPRQPQPTVTRGSVAKQITTRLPKCKIVDLAKVDEVLVELRESDAWKIARREIAREEMAEPGVGRENAVVHGGVAYWYELNVQTRRI